MRWIGDLGKTTDWVVFGRSFVTRCVEELAGRK